MSATPIRRADADRTRPSSPDSNRVLSVQIESQENPPLWVHDLTAHSG